MRKMMVLLSSGLLGLLLSTSAMAALSHFVGNWKNIDANTAGVTRIQVSVSGTNVKVHAWGKCHPQDCDWGTVAAIAYAPKVSSPVATTARAVSATFTTGFSQTVMILRPVRNNRLRADVYTRFTDNSGRSNYTNSYTFAKSSGPGGGAGNVDIDCIPFNYQQAQVRRVNNRWKIVVGNMWLKDFGNNQAEAQQGLRIIRHYRLNKQCFVGRPDPSMEYYLTGNRSPSGALSGEDCTRFNPANVRVSQIGGRWKIVEGSHWIMDFGSKASEAQQALRIIRHHRFTRMCFVGRPNPSMTYFRR